MSESTALRRYLLEDGALGWVTPEYALIRAAKYLGVPPWELAQQPRFWHEKALLYERIEGEAQQERQRRDAPPAN